MAPMCRNFTKFDELEFLPVNIRDHGTYFILHVVTSCELPDGAKAHVAGPPSNNIVGIQEFPKDFESPHPFFRIRQPANSAAGRVGSCVSCIYLNEVGANAIKSVAGNFLAATEVDKMPRISPG